MKRGEPFNCPCCGSAATVEPHLIEAGCTVNGQTWPDWWTASVNCDSCALQFIGGGDTDEEAVEDALKGWNSRAAVTDEQFALAVHDGNLWGECSECKERQGYYLGAETIQRQQERIDELERMLEHDRLEIICYENDVDARDGLIRDIWVGIVREHPQGGFPDMGLMEKRMRELGIEV